MIFFGIVTIVIWKSLMIDSKQKWTSCIFSRALLRRWMHHILFYSFTRFSTFFFQREHKRLFPILTSIQPNFNYFLFTLAMLFPHLLKENLWCTHVIFKPKNTSIKTFFTQICMFTYQKVFKYFYFECSHLITYIW